MTQIEIIQQLIDALKTEQRTNSVSPLRLATIHQRLLDLIAASQPDDRFLRKDTDDRSAGKIAADGGLEAGSFTAGISGAMIDPAGNAEFGSLKIRSFLEVAELIVNRLSAIEGDQLLTEADTIEDVTDNGDGSYTLRLHQKWDGYFTAQIENNVIKGIYNDITSGLNPGTGQQKLNNAVYYTSWMNVISVDAAQNTIDVIPYPDQETPAGRNFPPRPMMKIARWGNSGDATDPRYAMRQQCLYLSSSEGRIVKLFHVTKPIIDSGNVAAAFGTLPGFLAEIDPRIIPGSQGVYVKDLIAQNFLKVDYQGRPTPSVVDRGIWTAGEQYYDGSQPNQSGEYERSLVYHNGHGWLSNYNGIADSCNEPRWNTTCWTHAIGDPALHLEFIEVDSIVDIANPSCPLSVRASYRGSDVTDSTAIYYDWTRQSQRDGAPDTASDNPWNDDHHNAGSALILDGADMNFQFGQPPQKLIFTVTATIHDPSNPNIQPQQAIFQMI